MKVAMLQVPVGFDKEKNILSKVTVEDLRKFGMIPEFLGRLPVICTLQGLGKESLVRILKEPKNAILKQYQKLFGLDGKELVFTDDAIEKIADLAIERGTGARGLRAIMESIMMDVMYEVPSDEDIIGCTITKDSVENNTKPELKTKKSKLA